MKSYDYHAVTYKGLIYCKECLPEGITKEEKDWEIRPIFADEEWDFIPTCAKCGNEHDYINLIEENA